MGSPTPRYDLGRLVEDFVAYRGDPEIHDGVVMVVEHNGSDARVVVKAESGRQLEILFSGVDSVTELHPVGMTLYSLSEMQAPEPLRRFVFTNWFEEDESDARLEILARDFECRALR
jgi:hypothetical protein